MTRLLFCLLFTLFEVLLAGVIVYNLGIGVVDAKTKLMPTKALTGSDSALIIKPP